MRLGSFEVPYGEAWLLETAFRDFIPLPFLAMSDDEPADRAAAGAYGPNYPRLRTLKAKYDPGNFFHMNQNIRPA